MANEKELAQFLRLLETNWNPDKTYGPNRTPGPNFKRNPDGSFDVDFPSGQEESIEKNRLKRIGPWKKNVAAPSVSTPWPIEMKPEPDLTRPDMGFGAEWLAWTEGSRPVRGHKTSLKKMGLKGQPKPELAMTEDRVENKLSGQVSYNFYRAEGKKIPSFNKYLQDKNRESENVRVSVLNTGRRPRFPTAATQDHRDKLIDLYGEKEGRKFWKVDVEAEREVWIKKQKEIWEYAKEFEKRTATKDTKKSNEYLPPMIITE